MAQKQLENPTFWDPPVKLSNQKFSQIVRNFTVPVDRIGQEFSPEEPNPAASARKGDRLVFAPVDQDLLTFR
jgi:hypothetical protein